jgi:hypothetical protein
MRKVLFSFSLVLLAGCGGGSDTATISPQKWCWSMQSGNVKGTFTTNGISNVNGVPSAGNYILTDASIYRSTFSDIETGSVSNGMYVIIQPKISFLWDGSAITNFSRQNGEYTNGFILGNGVGNSGNDGAFITFGIGGHYADTAYLSRVSIFRDSITPSVTPVDSTGKCSGEI